MSAEPSAFTLIQFLIEESHIVRKPGKGKPDINISFEPSGMIDLNKNIFQLNLAVTITDKNNLFHANIKSVGLFGFDGLISESNLPDYFFVNAPAIIYPYIRSYVATLTSLSGMTGIHLPIMVMTSIIDDLKKNTNTIGLKEVKN